MQKIIKTFASAAGFLIISGFIVATAGANDPLVYGTVCGIKIMIKGV